MHHPYKYTSAVTIVTISATTNTVHTAVTLPVPESLYHYSIQVKWPRPGKIMQNVVKEIYKNDVYVNIQDQSFID